MKRISKGEFIDLILDLDVGDEFDWDDSDGTTTISYRVGKMEWNDSTIVMIGGYGNSVMLSNIDGSGFDYGEIGQLVNDYFKSNFVDDYVFI